MNKSEHWLFWFEVLFLVLALQKSARQALQTLVLRGRKGPFCMVAPSRFWRRCSHSGHWFCTSSSQCPLDRSFLLNANHAQRQRIEQIATHPLVLAHWTFRAHTIREAFIRLVMFYEERMGQQLGMSDALIYWEQGLLWKIALKSFPHGEEEERS